jgi:predicted nucleic acid-binding protein
VSNAVGIDTCVVLRLLTGLPDPQARQARSFVEACLADEIRIVVNDLVAVEAYHALCYFYDVPKKEALGALRSLVATPGIHCQGHAVQVLAEYRGTGAGLSDRLIRADLLKHADRIVSFDKDFCRLPGVNAVPSSAGSRS